MKSRTAKKIKKKPVPNPNDPSTQFFRSVKNSSRTYKKDDEEGSSLLEPNKFLRPQS